jgi:benzodiazapine receptor
MNKRTLLSTVVFGALTGLAAAIGTIATRRSVDSLWYWRLKKPKFQPPREAFAPVWTGLYSLITASGAMVWNAPAGKARTRALALWGAQLALNAGWSAAFFGARRPKVALADSAALLASIVGYGVAAYRVNPVAAWLVAPYAAWTAFATAINAAIVHKNSRLMLRGWAGDVPPARQVAQAAAEPEATDPGDEIVTVPMARPVHVTARYAGVAVRN